MENVHKFQIQRLKKNTISKVKKKKPSHTKKRTKKEITQDQQITSWLPMGPIILHSLYTSEITFVMQYYYILSKKKESTEEVSDKSSAQSIPKPLVAQTFVHFSYGRRYWEWLSSDLLSKLILAVCVPWTRVPPTFCPIDETRIKGTKRKPLLYSCHQNRYPC